MPEASLAQLRRAYNASIAEVREVAEGLRILRLRLDRRPPRFEPGQYVLLGLGDWEPTRPGDAASAAISVHGQLIRRAYSLSARMLDDEGRLLHPHDDPLWEFYLALVQGTSEHPAQLTPRLFALRVGDRLFVGPKAKGHYTTKFVQPDDEVIFAATGTGEAPHNAMLAHLLCRGHRGPITCVVGTRSRRDWAYLSAHRRLEQMFPAYRYLPLTTREPANLDAARPDYVGKQYVQQLFSSGKLEQLLGRPLRPDGTHVFVCGNPHMVGAPHPQADGALEFPQAGGLCQFLESRGFRCDRPGQPGNVHFEQYGEN